MGTGTKTGFFNIGFVGNSREYFADIKEKAGVAYIDYPQFNAYIDSVWEARDSRLVCFDHAGEEVPAASERISTFLIDTGYSAKSTGETIYAAFSRKPPASLEETGWVGVRIGTRNELMNAPARRGGDAAPDLERYTRVSNYPAIARVVNELSGESLSADACKALLNESFVRARSEQTLVVVENEYDSEKRISFFPLAGNEKIAGAKLYVKMERNRGEHPTTEWFGAFVVTEAELKGELLSFYCFHVGSFVFKKLADANSFFNALAQKAMRENWKWSDDAQNDIYTQPILKSYLEYTYYRLQDEDAKAEERDKKIVSYNGQSFFNSGLLDRNFRQIIIVGKDYTIERNVPGIGLCRWNLLSDIRAYSHNEHEIAREFREDELPAIASYFTDYREVVFDARLDIHTNDNHIFEDGVARGRLPKYRDEYERVKNNEKELEDLRARIARDFDSARDRVKMMAERNYKLAVPQFYKEKNEIQFLLPIYLGEREEAEKPQCALVLSLDRSGRRPYYRGETILTLDMAYNNTRLIAKPDVFWLSDLV